MGVEGSVKDEKGLYDRCDSPCDKADKEGEKWGQYQEKAIEASRALPRLATADRKGIS